MKGKVSHLDNRFIWKDQAIAFEWIWINAIGFPKSFINLATNLDASGNYESLEIKRVESFTVNAILCNQVELTRGVGII